MSTQRLRTTATPRPRSPKAFRLMWTGALGCERADWREHVFTLHRVGPSVWTLTVELPKGGRRVTNHRTGPEARAEAIRFAQSL